jgi:hypothetical protein
MEGLKCGHGEKACAYRHASTDDMRLQTCVYAPFKCVGQCQSVFDLPQQRDIHAVVDLNAAVQCPLHVWPCCGAVASEGKVHATGVIVLVRQPHLQTKTTQSRSRARTQLSYY